MNGLVVGFTTSLPLLMIIGPIALMVVDIGLTDGVRRGWPAPLGIATVDLLYGSVAATAGLGLQRLLGTHRSAIGVVGGLTLLVLAAHLLVHARSTQPSAQRPLPPIPALHRVTRRRPPAAPRRAWPHASPACAPSTRSHWWHLHPWR